MVIQGYHWFTVQLAERSAHNAWSDIDVSVLFPVGCVESSSYLAEPVC